MSESEIPKYFKNFSEIQDRPNFNPNTQITLDNYQDLLAEYHFHESDQQPCQVLKYDGDCHQMHQNGFLGKTKTGQEALIGGDCAKKYFNADKNFAFRKKQIRTEISITESIDKLARLLNNKKILEESIETQSERLKNIKSGVKSVEVRLPMKINSVLKNMVKTGNRTVYIQLRFEERNENGEKEFSWIDQSIGAISGTLIWQYTKFGDIHKEINQIKETFVEVQLTREAGEKRLQSWLKTLSSLPQHIKNIDALDSAYQDFIQLENIGLLTFLVTDKKDKIQIAKLAIELNTKVTASNNDARKLLQQLNEQVSSSVSGRKFREYR